MANGSKPKKFDSKLKKITASILGLVALLTAIVQFREVFMDLLPGLKGVANISVLPAEISLVTGTSRKLECSVKDSKGNSLQKSVTWSSSNPDTASVSQDGVVKGLAVGECAINAEYKGKTGTALVHVGRVPVAALSLFPDSKTMSVGETVEILANTFDANRNLLPDRQVRWVSQNDRIATVTNKGVVTAQGAGSTNIAAESEGVSGRASLQVEGPPPSPGAGGAAPPQPTAATGGSGGGTSAGGTDTSPAKAGGMIHKFPPTVAVKHLPTGTTPGSKAASKVIISPEHVGMTAAVAAEFLRRIRVTNGLRTGNCSARPRLLIGNALVEISSDPQLISGVPEGRMRYSFGGRVTCPGNEVVSITGKGEMSFQDDKSYACRWNRSSPGEFTVTLERQ